MADDVLHDMIDDEGLHGESSWAVAEEEGLVGP